MKKYVVDDMMGENTRIINARDMNHAREIVGEQHVITEVSGNEPEEVAGNIESAMSDVECAIIGHAKQLIAEGVKNDARGSTSTTEEVMVGDDKRLWDDKMRTLQAVLLLLRNLNP